MRQADPTSGMTPMAFACQEGHLPVCEWLLRKGAAEDVRGPDHAGTTPLFLACHGGDMDMMRWLFENGAAGDLKRANAEVSHRLLVPDNRQAGIDRKTDGRTDGQTDRPTDR